MTDSLSARRRTFPTIVFGSSVRNATRAGTLYGASFARQNVRSGKQTLHAISSAEPKFAGVDPYIKHIDRNADDNVVGVE